MKKLVDLIIRRWDLDEEEAECYANLLDSLFENEKLKQDIVKKELYCNRYDYCCDYYDLVDTLINDDILWEDDEGYIIGDEDFLNELKTLSNCSKNKIKNKLNSYGWYCKDNVAICFDDEVLAYINDDEYYDDDDFDDDGDDDDEMSILYPNATKEEYEEIYENNFDRMFK